MLSFSYVSCLITIAVLVSEVQSSFVQLCKVLDHFNAKQGKNVFDCIKYNGYGCYCGLGGHGKAVDEIDACCKSHDQCYGRIIKEVPKLCIPHLVWYKFKKGKCYDKGKKCAWAACNCDRLLGKCVQGKKLNHLHKYYRDFWKC